MRRPLIIASILVLTLACDKPIEEEAPPPLSLTDMSTASAVLFQVFGAREAPKHFFIQVFMDRSPQRRRLI